MADTEPDPAAEQALDQRISSLETGQQNMTEKLDKLLGIVSAGSHPDDGSGQPSPEGAPNIAHEIRQQLDAAAKKKTEEDGLKGTITELQTKLSELAEKAPAPMPRRIEKIMGWA